MAHERSKEVRRGTVKSMYFIVYICKVDDLFKTKTMKSAKQCQIVMAIMENI